MKYYCAIDIGAPEGRHILGRVENGCIMTEAATGLPVTAGPTEGTAIGNLMAQMIALGELTDLTQARSHIDCSM